MSPGDTAATNPGAKTRTALERDRARLLRVSRKREFANLRLHMSSGQGANTVAGLRSQIVRDKSISRQALEKIDQIGAHLENLWSPGDAKPAAIGKPALVSALNNSVLEEPPSMLVPQPETAIDKSPQTTVLTPPHTTELAPPELPVHNPMAWASDPTLSEVAKLCLQRQDTAAQSRLRTALTTQNERTALAYHQALLLLEICRLLGDMAGFDDTVMEYVHWWNDTPPLWDVKPAPLEGPSWNLQGDMQGAESLQLPELDLSQGSQTSPIDCTALLRMDQQAANALLGWLRRAQARNATLSLETSSVLVYLQWTVTGMDQFATLRKI